MPSGRIPKSGRKATTPKSHGANPATSRKINRKKSGASRDLNELATFPPNALPSWKWMSPHEKEDLLSKIASRFGAIFSNQLKSAANAGNKPKGSHYVNVNSAELSDESLRSQGYALAQRSGGQSGVPTQSWWVHPSGKWLYIQAAASETSGTRTPEVKIETYASIYLRPLREELEELRRRKKDLDTEVLDLPWLMPSLEFTAEERCEHFSAVRSDVEGWSLQLDDLIDTLEKMKADGRGPGIDEALKIANTLRAEGDRLFLHLHDFDDRFQRAYPDATCY